MHPDRVLAGQPLQPAGEERLLREMATVLLADDDDERGPVDARCRKSADGVAQPGRRVQEHERSLVAGDRPAGGDADDGALVQRQDEAEVVRQIRQERDLGRARVGEDGRQPAAAQDVEGGVTHRPGGT